VIGIGRRERSSDRGAGRRARIPKAQVTDSIDTQR